MSLGSPSLHFEEPRPTRLMSAEVCRGLAKGARLGWSTQVGRGLAEAVSAGLGDPPISAQHHRPAFPQPIIFNSIPSPSTAEPQQISLMPGSAQIRSDLPTQSMADEGRSGQRNEPMAYEHLSSTCRHLPRSARSMLKTVVGCSYMPRSPSGSAWLATVSIRRRRRAAVGSTDCVAYVGV
ncbi:hypothetical protein C8R44DRAFT_742696 [Mycena epipterygia]|nr:hypothetical protein C8R44DRAFT_742696 [Mycena epipterygia]